MHCDMPSLLLTAFVPLLYLHPGVKFALPKLVTGITRQLFLEDSPQIIGRYLAYDEEEFLGVWPLTQQQQVNDEGAGAGGRPRVDWCS